MTDDITIQEGHVYGGWRRAVNAGLKSDNIHSDDVAKKAGFRGGAVVGVVHLNLFPPLLLKTFGRRWFEQGSLSIYYTYALVDGEQVRGVMAQPPEGVKDAQVEAWAETPEGQPVGKGTASVGEPGEISYLQSLELKNAEPAELRILAGVKAGDELPSRDVLITQDTVNRTLGTITDSLNWYRSDSPWGGAIVPPSVMSSAMVLNLDPIPKAVQFYGATELRNVNGPIKVGLPYRATGKVKCVDAGGKTELYWLDSFLDDMDGKRIAEMRLMYRYMKSSSRLYNPEAEEREYDQAQNLR